MNVFVASVLGTALLASAVVAQSGNADLAYRMLSVAVGVVVAAIAGWVLVEWVS